MRKILGAALFGFSAYILWLNLPTHRHAGAPLIFSGMFRYVNSDAVYVPALLADLRSGANSGGWTLPPAPSFFPDFPIYFFWMQFLDVAGAAYCAGLSMLLWNLFSLRFFLHSLPRKAGFRRTYGSLFVFAALLLYSLLRSWIPEEYFALVLSNFHAGAIGSALLSYGLLLRYERKEGSRGGLRLGSLLVLAGISSLSDSIYVALVVPSFVAWLLLRRNRYALLSLVVLLAGIAAGRMSVGFVSDWLAPIFRVSPEKDVLHFFRAHTDLAWLREDLALPTVLYPLLFSLFLGLYAVFRRPARGMLLIAIAIPASAIIASAFSRQVGLPRLEYRYALLPLFAASGVACVFLFRGRFLFLIAAIWLTVLLLREKPETRTEHPVFLARNCLIRLTEDRRLGRGLADYWNSKMYQVLSAGKLRVIQVDEGLQPRMWINNLDWYFPKGEPDTFDFIITNGLPEDEIRRRMGEPAERASCEHLRVWIYRNGSMQGVTPFSREAFQAWRTAVGR